MAALSRQRPGVLFIALGLAALLLVPIAAAAAPRIEFELGTAQGFPATSAQQWYQLLTDLKVDNLRIRTGKAGEQPGIETIGGAANPTYKVTGILTAGDELQLPGGKFGSRDRGRLSAWLETLRSEGPQRAAGAPRLAFGLSQQQLTAAGEDLARPVDFATKDVKPGELITRIGRGLKFPLSINPAAAGSLRDAAALDAELRTMARGTALAYVLDQQGLALAPKLDARRQVGYVVAARRAGEEAWSVGRPLKARRADLLPELFEFRNVDLQGVPAADVLATVAERLNVPVLLDRRALAHFKIDMAAAKVNLPMKRTTYDAALRKAFTAGKAKDEWREDDAGRPFLWITSPKPVPAGP